MHDACLQDCERLKREELMQLFITYKTREEGQRTLGKQYGVSRSTSTPCALSPASMVRFAQ